MVRRLGWWILGVGLLGTAAAAIVFTPRDAAGFALGAAGAYFNMRWLASGLRALEKPSVALLGARFILIGGAAYVILEIFAIRPAAILAGLLTVGVAAILEVLFQLIYART
jgi:hypothetical protein